MCALTNNDSWVLHFNKDLLTSTDVRERTQALEAELAQTSAQLQQLQALQASLRTKNQLLEKLLHLNKQADFKSSPELPQSSAVSFSMHSILQAHFDASLAACSSSQSSAYQNAIMQSLCASQDQDIPLSNRTA